jgi:rhodanese-related sulfurtransferase
MTRCHRKDYGEMLDSLYNHTVPLINSVDLVLELKNKSPIFLLDTRSKAEFSVSHIEGARLIDYDHFTKNDMSGIPIDAKIVVYCSVGYRSEKIGEKIIELGYKDVRNLYGGIFQWKNEDFEVVNENTKITDSVHTYNKKWSKWLKNGVKVF